MCVDFFVREKKLSLSESVGEVGLGDGDFGLCWGSAMVDEAGIGLLFEYWKLCIWICMRGIFRKLIFVGYHV